MSEMKEYEVEIGGLMHTVLLDDATAEARDLTPKSKAAAPAGNKARKPSNKSAS